MEKVLSRTQSELVALERKLVLAVRDAIARADGARADVERLGSLVHEMDELFLLVVVGEYNTGKSTFINSLLGDEVFAMGDLPTTRAISVLRYGEPGAPEPAGEHMQVYHYPLDVLHDLEIVDTPGTNSIERMEEEITRDFVPRADLILFVTSLLQPLTASELGFLGHIRDWRKKTIFVVNGVDRRNTDDQVARVREYLQREVTARLGGPPPTIYFVSALRALRGKMAARLLPSAGAAAGGADTALAAATAPAAPDPVDQYPTLERYLLETLRESERVRLKLLSPLGVLRTVLGRNLVALDGRLTVVQEDRRILRSIREQLDAYTAEMHTDSVRYLSDVRNVLYDVERRGKAWLEDTIRLTNFSLLRNKDAVENRFRNEVVADAPRQVEDVVNRMVDWTVRRNLKLWTTVLAELEAHTERLRASGALAPSADTEFHYNREELFARLRQPVEHRLEQFDAEREAQGIVHAVNEAVTQTLGVQVFALGLGAALVAAFTTVMADVSGVLMATLLAVAGLFILPARRRKLGVQLEEKIAKLNTDLAALLSTSFTEQLGRYETQLVEVVQPYERFLDTENTKLDRALGELRGAENEVQALERRVAEAFPEDRSQ